MRNEKAKIFDVLLASFENEDIKNFAVECIETIPDYFWDVGASSTGKYHPQYALGDLGLARHTCALVRILNHIMNVRCFGERFSSRERDLMRVAGIMHDSRKSGDDKDYAKSKYTKFNHPILAADEVRSLIGFISEDELEIIATTIESHMGEWNTDRKSSVILPMPTNKYQKMLHLADYLASRKDIEILFDEYVAPETPDIKDYVLSFGKHKGEKLIDVAESDPSYIEWAKENMNKEPVRSLLKKL